MWTIYLLGLIGSLNAFCAIACFVLFVLVSLGIIHRNIDLSDYDHISYKEERDAADKWLKRGAISFLICMVGVVFIPSEKQLYAIVGIGGTLDYLKNNDKAKQIPDKVIDAVYKYLDDGKEEKGE
jgi:Ca2+/Na+ antiporter